MSAIKSKKSQPRFTFKEGVVYVCVKAASPGYKQGNLYECYRNKKGLLCLQGEDGFEDYTTMLVSDFAVYEKQENKANLTTVM
jgi:hypothetical protein